MNKDKLYDPVKIGSFQMMFGFKQPTTYYKNKWVSIAKVRITESSKIRDENK
tara:strand:- start:1414 stop:1569 length:156 start_codon:yes stop_codon:yes gene_type:complete